MNWTVDVGGRARKAVVGQSGCLATEARLAPRDSCGPGRHAGKGQAGTSDRHGRARVAGVGPARMAAANRFAGKPLGGRIKLGTGRYHGFGSESW
jgi:hypothetical protein